MDSNSNDTDNNSKTIFELIEREFGRVLSPMEYEIIKAWTENNISNELIEEAGTYTATVTADGLRVHKEPLEESGIITVIRRYSRLTVFVLLHINLLLLQIICIILVHF